MTPAELTAVRKALGLTQQQLGDALGVSRATVNRWERGKCAMPKAYSGSSFLKSSLILIGYHLGGAELYNKIWEITGRGAKPLVPSLSDNDFGVIHTYSCK